MYTKLFRFGGKEKRGMDLDTGDKAFGGTRIEARCAETLNIGAWQHCRRLPGPVTAERL